MKFLANENFPSPSIITLRDAGCDVKSISESSPTISDKQVLQIAKSEDRIILTFDKDYGKLIFQFGFPNPPAVIFFRVKGDSPLSAGNYLLRLINNKFILSNNFTVIEADSIRQRKYS